jgi:hypothetical protein
MRTTHFTTGYFIMLPTRRVAVTLPTLHQTVNKGNTIVNVSWWSTKETSSRLVLRYWFSTENKSSFGEIGDKAQSLQETTQETTLRGTLSDALSNIPSIRGKRLLDGRESLRKALNESSGYGDIERIKEKVIQQGFFHI